MNKKQILVYIGAAVLLAACGGQQNEQDKQIQENQKKIELLKQEAEIKRLQGEVQNAGAQAASAVAQAASSAAQVYQLAASEVANTIPKEAQAAAKAGEVVQGKDGQQYTFDPDTGSWLLYGALGAAAGYLAANAMNKNKYEPASKPTAAVERVHQDYQAKHPSQVPAPKPAAAAPQNKPFVPANAPAQQQSPNQRAAQPAQQQYRPTQQAAPSNHQRPSRIGGGRKRR